MSKDSAIDLRCVEKSVAPLSELLLQGAKHLIRQAVDAELQELLGKFKH